jgi:hypothetical protein
MTDGTFGEDFFFCFCQKKIMTTSDGELSELLLHFLKNFGTDLILSDLK